AVLGQPAGVPGWHDIGDYPQAKQVAGLVVFRYDSPLFFADAEDFQRRAWQAVQDAEPPARWLLLNVEGIIEVDLTGLDALAGLVDRCHRHDVVVAVVRAKSELVVQMQRHGVAAAIGQDRFYPTLPTAVSAYESWVQEHPVRPSDPGPSDSMGP
ncbi:MAG: STAS domain-containing protein, partial [Candidatus Nanopelagicales bacterium]